MQVLLGFAVVIFQAVGQIFLKKATLLGNPLHSYFFYIGFVFLGLNFVAWMLFLREVSLSVAWAIAGIAFIVVPVLAWLWLHETLSITQGFGFILMSIGIFMVCGLGSGSNASGNSSPGESKASESMLQDSSVGSGNHPDH
jgi:drug/metabolite transporter (DMT)-like permease